jgi:uncharacterized protein
MITPTLRAVLAALVLVASCTPAAAPTPMPPPLPSPASASGPEATARVFVGDLAARRFSAATGRFSQTMRAAMPEAKLEAAWADLEQAAGAFQGVDGARLVTDRSFLAVHLTTRFAKARKDLKVVFDSNERVTGFWIAPVEGDLETAARALVDDLVRGDFAAATAGFDATMAAALPVDKLDAAWRQVKAQAGAFQRVEGVKIAHEGGAWSALVTCSFASAKLVAKVVFDGNDRVAGLFFVPEEAAGAWQVPSYAHPETFVERDVKVSLGAGGPELPGNLALPKGAGPFPAVVLVHGSGPNDADESIGGNKVFKDLAWGLASNGIAVLRYVKRSRQAPAGIVGVKEEVLDAAHAAIELCRTTPEIDPRRVVVVGHSQGGELGPRIAAENPAVAGLVVLAGNTRPLQDLVVDQFKYFAKLHPENPDAARRVAEAEAFKRKLDDPALKPDEPVSFPGAPSIKLDGAYFLSMRGYRPAEVAASLSIPLLVLQGDRDYQVTAPDLAGWKNALGKKPNATIKQYPACNHLFIAGSGESTPEEYLSPRHVDEEVIRDIASFVSRVPKR